MFSFFVQDIDDNDLLFDEQNSILQDTNDVDDLFAADPAVLDENWLWGSVRRVRRSINQLLNSKPAATAVKSKQKLHKRQPSPVTSVDDEFDELDNEKDGSGDYTDSESYPLSTHRNEIDNFKDSCKFSPSLVSKAFALAETQTRKALLILYTYFRVWIIARFM